MPKTFRNVRELALQKGTVPSGFDGQAYSPLGPQSAQAGYTDPSEAARARMDLEAGDSVDALVNPPPFKLTGGK
jgi:hypothetical protein